MTAHDPHAPRADFVSALEREVLRTYRNEAATTRITASPRPRWHEQWRVAAALIIGLAVGAGVPLASAQVQGARTRSELERSIEVDREVHVLRLQLAQQEHERVRNAFAAGALSQQSLLQAAADLNAMQGALTRIDLDLAEVRLTSATPRDELWAPLVGGRDFVKQRLQLRAASAQQRLSAAEAQLASVMRRADVGAEGVAAVASAEIARELAAGDLDKLAMQLKVRDQALAGQLSPAEVTRRLQGEVMNVEIVRAQTILDILTARVEMARRQFQAGTLTEVDLRRLELDVMERRIQLDRMKVEMRSRINWQFGKNDGSL